ncbi:DUF423 domain-containing protein [Aliidiomarina minuta]|uniref:DUF423 domain-containing protein n=1 Tax=Aliidiomarina minuta TaxID=880057 RepID=A0A432W5P0_9GAMM|nr:DUF423 domain-containing protein [Aliidiomarina minuta]RUO25390.1 DUF423 domain-containing protein [Aliidiomarina minuta]
MYWIIMLAAVLGGLSVAMGAFAAHGLQNQLSSQSLEVFKTGVQYQFIHALALLAIGVWAVQQPQGWLQVAAIAWLIGIILFSGSLYGLSILEWRWLGPVTPLGGISFIIGWIAVFMAAWRAAAKVSGSL